jgi:RNA polymerase sigma factor for flagellar operon FliA
MNEVSFIISDWEMTLVKNIGSKVYKKFCSDGKPFGLGLEDIQHCGIVGLCQAKQDFNPESGVPYKAWAALRIRWSIMDAIREDPIVRLSPATARKIKALKETRAKLQKEGQPAADGLVAKKLGWSIEDVHKIEAQAIRIGSTDQDQNPYGEQPGSWVEVLTSREPDAEAQILKKELATVIQKCLESFRSPESRHVLMARHMEGLTLRELASVYGRTEQTILNWQRRAEEFMKGCLERNGMAMEDIEG